MLPILGNLPLTNRVTRKEVARASACCLLPSAFRLPLLFSSAPPLLCPLHRRPLAPLFSFALFTLRSIMNAVRAQPLTRLAAIPDHDLLRSPSDNRLQAAASRPGFASILFLGVQAQPGKGTTNRQVFL